jgi:hypothetical protein
MSNNLNLSQVADNQAQKEVTINTQAGEIDAALTETYLVEVTSSNAYTLTNAEFRGAAFFTVDEDSGDAADADFTITCPAIKRGLFVIINATAFVATVEISGQAGDAPTVAAGATALLASDGTNVSQPAGSGGGGTYDIGGAFGGSPGSGDIVFQFIFPRAVTFPAGLTGSQGVAGTAPTATATFDVKKNGSDVGDMVFDASTDATFVLASDTSFAAGDLMEIVAPASADATLADLVFTLAGGKD